MPEEPRGRRSSLGHAPERNTNGTRIIAQEFAFFSWFYHQKPSLGVNGWYSNGGTFKKAATVCH